MQAMAKNQTNWSGSLKFTPGALKEPSNENELLGIVNSALKSNQRIRVMGAGHSSSPLVETDKVLVSLKKFKAVDRIDKENSTAWIGTGLTVKEGGSKLLHEGLSFHNTGDVDVQYVSGAISTGTHGTGKRLQNLSSMLIGCRMVCADGELRELNEERDGKPFFDAMRVSLGTLGIMTHMKLKLLPAFKLDRKEWCTHIDNCLENLDDLMENNRNFDFYWYPRSDMAKIRILNEPGIGTQHLDYARRVQDISGWAIDVLPKERDLKFDEMEYALPMEAGPDCFQAVRKLVKEKFRRSVAWRVLYRTIRADDFYLSPYFSRDSVTISLHQNAGLEFKEYFERVEHIFRDFGGRPHWGKKHNLQGGELNKLYPKWNDFLEIRQRMDPKGMFLNDHLNQLFNL
jgi:FAD/FMN-containing dehydrogenase